MNTSRWPEVDRLFHLAGERRGHERAVFLEAACDGDVTLQREIESLLQADAGSVLVLDHAVEARDSEDFEPGRLAVEPGDQLGPYRVRRLIGEGGMGAVFLAERNDEHFNRPVAIKVLKQAFFSSAALGRFHNECQALARLEHPNVARLYDIGTTEHGVPYMVMEYLEGTQIDEYAVSLGFKEILTLFAAVCDAVAYAHQRLIVHRDLKPGNILVTAEGTPKLLDFGIAKLLDSTAATTRTAARPMTPRYASPEQLRGDAITTATDVYSLGLLLHELLTGPLPDEQRRAALDIPPPSTVVADRQLRRRLRGDLDTILQKALAADPTRRYSSVERLADDLRRHLVGLPVLAQRPTVGYRMGRFVRRHTWSVAATLLFMVFLFGAVLALSIFARDAAQQRDRARIESTIAREVTTFMVNFFRASRPEEHQGREPKVHEILEWGAERLRGDLGLDPEVRAAFFQALGEAYLSRSRFAEAANLLESALELRRQALGNDDPEVAAVRLLLAEVEVERSRFDRAEELVRDALRVFAADPGASDEKRATALSQLGSTLAAKGHFDQAEEFLRRSLALRRDLFESSHPAIGESHYALAGLFFERRDWAAAKVSYQKALEILAPARGDADPQVVVMHHDLANVLQNLGDDDGALTTYKEILAIQKRLYGEVHANIAATLNSLGTTYYDLEDFERSEELFRAAIDMLRQLESEDTVDVGLILNNLGRTVDRRGRLPEAVDLYREAVEILRLRSGADSPSPGLALTYLGRTLTRMGRAAEAEKPLRQAEALFVTRLGEDHYRVDVARINLAVCLNKLGHGEKAEALLSDSLDRLRRQLGPEHLLTRQAAAKLEKIRAPSGSPPETPDENR